jgi:hypothetical protein
MLVRNVGTAVILVCFAWATTRSRSHRDFMQQIQLFLFSDALAILMTELEVDALRATREAIVPLVEGAFPVQSAWWT